MVGDYQPWMEKGACKNQDPALFFSPDDRAHTWRAGPGKAICADCPVRLKCLKFALDVPIIDGLWGGMTREERKTVRRG